MHDPFLMFCSSFLHPSSHLLLPTLILLSTSYKVLSDYIKPTWIIWDHLHISRDLIYRASHLQDLFYMVIYSQVLGIRTWTSLGAIIQPITIIFYVLCNVLVSLYLVGFTGFPRPVKGFSKFTEDYVFLSSDVYKWLTKQ